MAAFEDVLSCAKSVAQAAGRKTEEFVELTKVRVQIGDQRREIAAIFEGLGRLVYDSRHTDESMDELIDTCVAELEERLAVLERLEERVMATKHAVRCPYCGGVNASDAVFCNQCGEKI